MITMDYENGAIYLTVQIVHIQQSSSGELIQIQELTNISERLFSVRTVSQVNLDMTQKDSIIAEMAVTKIQQTIM
jgi:hypothetical protein